MTREEIIKAIETCYERGEHSCLDCPLCLEDECNDKLWHEVLALLKKQEALDGSALTKKGGMMMPDREKVIKGLRQHCEGSMFDRCGECPYYEVADEPFQCRDALLMDTIAMLKEQELPTELKQKMWLALYAEEDEYEKKFVGKEEHLNWFTVYRPWLQKGFDIAINSIAEWEGR